MVQHSYFSDETDPAFSATKAGIFFPSGEVSKKTSEEQKVESQDGDNNWFKY